CPCRRSMYLISIGSVYYGNTTTFCFSSRRRHTRSKRDWSSDVCSSDLLPASEVAQTAELLVGGELDEGPAGTTGIVGQIVHGIRRPGADAGDPIEIEPGIEQRDDHSTRQRSPHTTAFEDQSGVFDASRVRGRRFLPFFCHSRHTNEGYFSVMSTSTRASQTSSRSLHRGPSYGVCENVRQRSQRRRGQYANALPMEPAGSESTRRLR